MTGSRSILGKHRVEETMEFADDLLSVTHEGHSAFTQDSLFCYGDAIQTQRNMVCTMRIVPDAQPAGESLALFGQAVSAEHAAAKSNPQAEKTKSRAVHCFYNVADLKNLEHVLAGATDTYISQAVFDQPRRREVNVSSIQTLFVDLDTYNVGVDPMDAAARVCDMFDAIGLEEPTVTTVSSGRGLYVKLPLESEVERHDLSHWKRVERGLIHMLSPLGADPKARDASRVLRAIGTRNSKNGGTVEVLRQASGRVKLEQVDGALEKAGFYQEKAARAARSTRTTSPLPAIDLGEGMDETELSWARAFAPFSLEKFRSDFLSHQAQAPRAGKAAMLHRKYREFCWSALADIDQLARMRGGVFRRGTRDASVFWSLVLLARADLVSPENFWTEAFALTARTAGRYDPFADGSLNTLFNKLCQAVSARQDSMYVATKDRLMDEMAISSDEEREMAVLCSHAEYKRRDRASVRMALNLDGLRVDERKLISKMVRYVDQEHLRARNECRQPRVGAEDIATKLGIHPKTAKKHLVRLADLFAFQAA